MHACSWPRRSPSSPPLPRRAAQTLKGATIFMSDLVRAMDPVPDGLELAFVRASSYGAGTTTSGKVTLGITTLADVDIEGRHLLLVSAAPPIRLRGCRPPGARRRCRRRLPCPPRPPPRPHPMATFVCDPVPSASGVLCFRCLQ